MRERRRKKREKVARKAAQMERREEHCIHRRTREELYRKPEHRKNTSPSSSTSSILRFESAGSPLAAFFSLPPLSRSFYSLKESPWRAGRGLEASPQTTLADWIICLLPVRPTPGLVYKVFLKRPGIRGVPLIVLGSAFTGSRSSPSKENGVC